MRIISSPERTSRKQPVQLHKQHFSRLNQGNTATSLMNTNVMRWNTFGVIHFPAQKSFR
ncbi:hypothetical protein BGX38DRAFT_1164627 [Terfezia claveryi]|nr:hypothetical protein BGX38DRAFT_1164627 [Terfezia claveryi]